MTRSRLITSDRLFCNIRHSMHFFISNLLYYLQVSFRSDFSISLSYLIYSHPGGCGRL
jgi:hypothetical protein